MAATPVTPAAPGTPGSSVGTTGSAPRRIGRYELLGRIASGGMATVYLGRSLGVRGFSRLVAIKKLHPGLEQSSDIVALFFEEAKVAARIRHPNVVPVLDVDETDGLYIVMEYVEGDQLLGLLHAAAAIKSTIPLPIALRIAVDFLAGLHAAHELVGDRGERLNIVHRDVSPHNVLVGTDGITKLTDFGIARADSRDTITRDGELKGKIAYMAPEQAAGHRVDRRADVFASGIVLWEMFCGRRLFRGETSVATLTQVLAGAVTPLASMGVPEAISRAVQKALERDPAARWQTAAELAEALEAAAASAGGIASARQVAEHVRRVSGEKIASESRRLLDDPDASGPAAALGDGASLVGNTVSDLGGTGTTRAGRSPLFVAALGAAAALVIVVSAAAFRYAVGPAAPAGPAAAAAATSAPLAVTPTADVVPVVPSAATSASAVAPVASSLPAPPAPSAHASAAPSSARPHPHAPPKDSDSIAPNPYHHAPH